MNRERYNYISKVNKSNTLKLHFKKRFKQRTGNDCNKETYNKILSSIKNNKSVFLYKISNRVIAYLIKLDACYIIIYDALRDCLVTIIKEEQFNNDQKQVITNLSNKQKQKLEKYNNEKSIL